MNMSELAQLPLADRLQAMEILWTSLAQDPAHDPSPVWHEEVLAQRLAAIEAGTEPMQDWDSAKHELSARIDERKAKQGQLQ
jgi:hypothetical protein